MVKRINGLSDVGTDFSETNAILVGYDLRKQSSKYQREVPAVCTPRTDFGEFKKGDSKKKMYPKCASAVGR